MRYDQRRVIAETDGEKTESDFLNTLRNGQKFNMRLTAKAKKYNFDGRLVLAFFVPSCIVKPIYVGILSILTSVQAAATAGLPRRR